MLHVFLVLCEIVVVFHCDHVLHVFVLLVLCEMFVACERDWAEPAHEGKHLNVHRVNVQLQVLHIGPHIIALTARHSL
jgi:hypothetical protein